VSIVEHVTLGNTAHRRAVMIAGRTPLSGAGLPATESVLFGLYEETVVLNLVPIDLRNPRPGARNNNTSISSIHAQPHRGLVEVGCQGRMTALFSPGPSAMFQTVDEDALWVVVPNDFSPRELSITGGAVHEGWHVDHRPSHHQRPHCQLGLPWLTRLVLVLVGPNRQAMCIYHRWILAHLSLRRTVGS
jgi:hypothetical protein